MYKWLVVSGTAIELDEVFFVEFIQKTPDKPCSIEFSLRNTITVRLEDEMAMDAQELFNKYLIDMNAPATTYFGIGGRVYRKESEID